MRPITSVAALCLVSALTACGDSTTGIIADEFLSPQQLAAAGVTDLSGRWTLDPSQSTFVGGTSGRPANAGGRGSWGGRPAGVGGRPDGVGGRPGRPNGTFDGTLTIAQSATLVSINGMTIPTNGAVVSGRGRAGAGVSASALWSESGLTITRTAPNGPAIIETLSVSADGSTLTASMSGGSMPTDVKRVFKRG